MVGANINYTKHECFKINGEVLMFPLCSYYIFQTINYYSDYTIKKKKNLDSVGKKTLKIPHRWPNYLPVLWKKQSQ